jgi:hypothetical protein
MLKRIVWLLKSVLLLILVFFPILVLQLLWCGLVWLTTGEDLMMADATPMGWADSGWRVDFVRWPLNGWTVGGIDV